jgi:hypothetical protein
MADSKRIIAAEWASYLNEVVPKNASVVQILETKRAFYGGALSAFTAMITAGTQKRMPEVMDSLTDEFEAYSKGLDRTNG